MYTNRRYYIGNNYSRYPIAYGVSTNNKFVGNVAQYNTPISRSLNNAAPKSYIPPLIVAPLPTGPGLGPNQLVFASPGTSPCNLCPNTNAGGDSTLSILSVILQSLDFVS